MLRASLAALDSEDPPGSVMIGWFRRVAEALRRRRENRLVRRLIDGGRAGDLTVLPLAESLLASSDDHLALTAAIATVRLGASTGLGVLLRFARDAGHQNRDLAIAMLSEATASRYDDEIVALLVEIVASPQNPQLWSAAVFSLGKLNARLGQRSHSETLARTAGDKSAESWRRSKAIEALGYSGQSDDVLMLLKLKQTETDPLLLEKVDTALAVVQSIRTAPRRQPQGGPAAT